MSDFEELAILKHPVLLLFNNIAFVHK